jgi:DNA-binding transcriptional MerR regulator
MLIGELAAKTGLSRDTIRFYEKQGLLLLGRKARRDNNYKEYGEEAVGRLLMIKGLKGLGFTLNETGDLLAMMEEKLATCVNVEELFSQKVALLDKKFRELIALRNQLQDKVSRCRSGCCVSDDDPNCPILMEKVPMMW